ncbi:hypothetical protein HPP92_003657 [Vanilla planifolia]|uniref:Transmembrane protein 131-like N-terminal domain-containing protein n=1 Tax=Vanilla planifolia TaxID=51239 RepID=A0A835VJL0_VANPL|nr:hypothetical protein HPP92_004109 [Vanilla planifolia]KAG0503585.1 hypothetical protein HPP92_003657 [Vanilla planifolia]
MKEVQAGSVDQLRFLSSLMSSRCLLCHKTASWLVVVAFLVLFLPIASSSSFCVVGADVSRQHDGCISFADFGGSFFSQQNYYRLRDVCSGSGTFCFPSTLVDFIGEKDGEQVYTFRVSKGTVSCSLMDFVSGTHGEQAFSKEMDALEIVDFCEASIVSDIWMRTQPNAWYNDLDEHLDEAEVGILGSFPSLAIDIKPSMLDWETKNLYSPSLKILKVVNRHNNSVLRVFDIFSTNTQFVVYGFQTLSLEPGKSASIPFIFIPRWLGLSLAQLVLQTSFGGFVIHAKGIAISSPYQVQPLAGLSISMSERLNGNLSIFNPSTDFLYVKELAAWILFSGSEKDHLAHIFCTTNEFQQSTSELSSPMGSDWYVLKSGKVGSPRMNIWLHQQLEVQPNKAETILKLNLWPHLAKKISGSICMKLGNSSHDKFDTVIVPLDIEMNQIESYSHSSGSLSLYFNTLTPCNGRNTIFALSLRNDAPCLLSIIKISEVTKGCRLLEIRYMEGLLVFPGTVTQIALITYVPSLDSQDRVSEIHSTGLNCMLTIKTNDSLNPVMNIPCDDLIRKSCKYEGVVQMLDIESSSATLMEKQENEKSANTRAASLGNDIKESLSRKAKPLDLIEIDDLILDNWRSHATTSKLSVLQDQEILFPVVQIGSHFLKWIRVYNPSEKPVVMQLVLNPGVIIDHCISHDDLSEHTILPKFSVIDSAEMRVGFSMAETAVTEAFVHPLRSALFGPVIFRPSSHCMWRSTALIKTIFQVWNGCLFKHLVAHTHFSYLRVLIQFSSLTLNFTFQSLPMCPLQILLHPYKAPVLSAVIYCTRRSMLKILVNFLLK